MSLQFIDKTSTHNIIHDREKKDLPMQVIAMGYIYRILVYGAIALIPAWSTLISGIMIIGLAFNCMAWIGTCKDFTPGYELIPFILPLVGIFVSASIAKKRVGMSSFGALTVAVLSCFLAFYVTSIVILLYMYIPLLIAYWLLRKTRGPLYR